MGSSRMKEQAKIGAVIDRFNQKVRQVVWVDTSNNMPTAVGFLLVPVVYLLAKPYRYYQLHDAGEQARG